MAAVSDSHLAANGTGVLAQGGPAPAATIQLTRSTVAHSSFVGAQSIGLNAFVFVSNSLMSGNAIAVQAVGAGFLKSYQNNAIDANFAPGAFTGTIVPE